LLTWVLITVVNTTWLASTNTIIKHCKRCNASSTCAIPSYTCWTIRITRPTFKPIKELCSAAVANAFACFHVDLTTRTDA
jgi:hypothetical protein